MSDATLRNLNLAFRFVLELIALVALAIWGFGSSDQPIISVVLGLGAPAIAIVVWGTFVAPKARRRLEDPTRLVVELLVFAAAALAFVAWGSLVLGVLLAASAILSVGLMYAWGQRGR